MMNTEYARKAITQMRRNVGLVEKDAFVIQDSSFFITMDQLALDDIQRLCGEIDAALSDIKSRLEDSKYYGPESEGKRGA